MVSSTQKASPGFVSATVASPHLIRRARSVLSHSGGLGKLCTLSFCRNFVAVVAPALLPIIGAEPVAESDIVQRNDRKRIDRGCMQLNKKN